MPNCFRLIPLDSTHADSLQDIDRAICDHLGIPCAPRHWAFDWYNVIGFAIAALAMPVGSEALRIHIREYPHASQLARILTWLEQNYRSEAWVEIGKR